MPFYEVLHAIPLSPAQEDALAEAITAIHLSKFPLVPKFFVNIVFTDISQKTTYIGGKRRRGNHLTGHVRLGTRSTTDFENMRDQLDLAWNRIVVGPVEAALGEGEGAKYKLHRLMLYPANSVGKEGGFDVPLGGQEKAWLDKHWDEFKRRADAGDDQFIDLVKTVEARNES